MKRAQDLQLQHLGQFFHLFRVSRNLTLQQAAGPLSVATLSRFERGEQDLASDKALVLMHRLGIENVDFLRYYDHNVANFPLGLELAIQYRDGPAIRHRQTGYFQTLPKAHAMGNLAAGLFDAAAHWAEPQFQLSIEQEQQVADCLADPTQFGLLENELVKAVSGVASHELLALLYHRAQGLDQRWAAIRAIWLLLLWLGALMNRDLELAAQIEADLAPAFAHYEQYSALAEYWPNWVFGQALAEYTKAPTDQAIARLQQLIADLEALGVHEDAQWYRGMWAHAQAGQVHHNFTLVDHAKQLPIATSLGTLIYHRRQYFGMRREDLAAYGSPSALRRFEHDQTQLSFTTLTQVMGQLALMPSQALTFIHRDAAHPNGAMGLRAAFLQIARQPDQAQMVLNQFESDNRELPATILSAQMFVLRTKAHVPLPADAKLAQQLFSRLLRTNTWYTLEMYLVQALAEWLPAAQLATLFQHGHRILLKSPLIGSGNNYFLGLNQAFARVVAHEAPVVVQPWLAQFKWLPTMNSVHPARWLAAGSWYTARYLIESTPATQAALQLYLARSRRVGHLEIPRLLTQTWQGQVAVGLFEGESI